ncbi:MAG: sodium-dependent transporter [Propionibacteriaceae bacterium]|jgi:NSS family neurotransmitter:Na+ symporter|nr:sodium-dependent transporter [Propionibacteriaceae bacterium]
MSTSASTGAAAPASTSAAPRQEWSGQLGFIISAIGSAVGLGNIWRFPGVAYENGGGAFLIPYLIALLTAGLPILFLDYAIGHRFRGSAPLAFRRMKRWLESLGWFQVMICFFIAIYYAAILAWAASYFVYSFGLKWGDDPTSFFLDYVQAADPGFSLAIVPGVLIPLVIIWIAAIGVLALGVAKGLEKANLVFIPLLVVAFLTLVIRALFLPGAADGLNALFTPDFSALTNPAVWIAAYSQIFFSLSIAFGIMITYSSYRRRKSNQTTPGLVVGFANSSFEILAGIGVFAILGFMAHEQGTTISELGGLKGVSLAFMTFPKVISEMPQGWFFGALFFASLLMAGFTSLISIVQVICGSFQDKFGWGVRKAAIVLGGICAVVSLLLFSTTTALNVLDVVDAFINNIGVVASAIVTCVIVVWVLRRGRELMYHLTSLSTFPVGTWWLALIGVVAPIMLVYMFVSQVITFFVDGYGGMPGWFLGVAGWGSVVLSVIGAFILTAQRWRVDPDDFTAWPAYTPTKKEAK